MPNKKAAKKNYKVAEVCKLVDIQPYVLRYWETEFQALERGGKNASSVYSEEQLAVVQRIKALLYDEGFTIAGAKKKLAAEMEDGLPEAAPPAEASSDGVAHEPLSTDESDIATAADRGDTGSQPAGVSAAVLESLEAGLEDLVGQARDLMKRLED